ncbi:MAG TPA: 16S rRNA (uracil(1498)-N(3))-methyltransferase [Nitrospirota bacterium]|nr:16S rRNA (uracil(1498)-N(3))-methyltransferase [Nitrospirota bacterium]
MSKPPRFFISPGQVSGPDITITDEDVRHIATVLRMKTGDQLLLCDGRGTEYTVKISDINKSAIKTNILGQTKSVIRYPLITLGQGLPKSDKMDWIVQKATELGTASIVALITERTIVKVKDEEKRLVRWRRICREAAMQSNRADIPTVEGIQTFKDYVQTLHPRPGTLLLLPWEEGTEPIKGVLRARPEVKNIVILIGPEGGFSAAEAALAKDKGFHAVSLGPNILRTETATVAVLGIIGYEYS